MRVEEAFHLSSLSREPQKASSSAAVPRSELPAVAPPRAASSPRKRGGGGGILAVRSVLCAEALKML